MNNRIDLQSDCQELTEPQKLTKDIRYAMENKVNAALNEKIFDATFYK